MKRAYRQPLRSRFGEANRNEARTDKRFSAKLQQGHLNLDAVFTIDGRAAVRAAAMTAEVDAQHATDHEEGNEENVNASD